MIADGEASLIAAARVGDRDAFGRLVDPQRRALLLHCYRFLGSLQDAEDVVQETLLRAWRRLHGFEGRSSFRHWLFRIATNACMDAREARARRVLPHDLGTAPNPDGPPAAPLADVAWLEPCPDTLLELAVDPEPGPEALFDRRESVELAFVAALQHLPPRQRAALLLRDVLAWSATETASLLGASVPAVNSALQRARATMSQRLPARDGTSRQDLSAAERDLLARYVHAWEARDVGALVSLLREDALLTMPPVPEWYRGREAIGRFLAAQWPVLGPFRLLPTRANGQPAFGLYGSGPGGDASYRPLTLQVLRLEAGLIAEIVGFIEPSAFEYPGVDLFPRFGLPPAARSQS
jgi:RNA polymerase sigma-70 factor, ECF subfamily